ncbi:MAG TPA: hypothetical protein VGJ15_14065 [Pirellulales bacterium]
MMEKAEGGIRKAVWEVLVKPRMVSAVKRELAIFLLCSADGIGGLMVRRCTFA